MKRRDFVKLGVLSVPSIALAQSFHPDESGLRQVRN
ncbi:hypothetical protein HDF11_004588 [Tunturiibacter psychrotolerans]